PGDQRARRRGVARTRDRACRTGGLEQCRGVDVVRVREAGLLAGDRAHANALLDRMRAVLDDAVLHRPALAPGMLEVQVAEIDAGAEQRTERAFQAAGVEARGQQEAGLGDLQRLGHAGFPWRDGTVVPMICGRRGEDQPAGAGPATAVACGGPRPTTSTSGSFHGPVTRYVFAESSPSGLRSTALAAAPMAAPIGPPAIAPTAVSRLPVRGTTSITWSKVCARRSAPPRIVISAAGPAMVMRSVLARAPARRTVPWMRSKAKPRSKKSLKSRVR